MNDFAIGLGSTTEIGVSLQVTLYALRTRPRVNNSTTRHPPNHAPSTRPRATNSTTHKGPGYLAIWIKPEQMLEIVVHAEDQFHRYDVFTELSMHSSPPCPYNAL
jgi:hypothetical protein